MFDRLKKGNGLLGLLPVAIIAIGILLRIVIYLQNRNLILDEANITRNLYEHGFLRLLSPLDYQQYAPPVFLWIEKLSTVLFGFSEYALRFYPLLAGLASLYIMYQLLRELVPLRSIWYAFFLFATAPIMLRYSSEIKQYIPDVLITLSLLLLALKTDVNALRRGRFTATWLLAGSLAIWSSMPSVFVLAAVGMYHFIVCLQNKNYKSIGYIALCSIVWFAQFLAYYFFILQAQANSDYLQNFHQHYFLFATPSSLYELDRNWDIFSALIREFGDKERYGVNVIFNTLLLLVGCLFLLKNNLAKAILLLTPIVLVLAASALNKFSLMSRVSLFVIPILLLIIAYGIEQLSRVRFRPVFIVLTAFCIVYALNGNGISMLWKPLKLEQITEGFTFFNQHKVKANNILLYHSSKPAYIYYTTIHPNKQQWQFAKGMNGLNWYTSYDSMAIQINQRWDAGVPVGFLCTNATKEEAAKKVSELSKHLSPVTSIDTTYIRAYVFLNTNR